MPSARMSQEFVPVKEIRNGVIILQGGEIRMLLMTSSLNFGLKSSDEQAAIILQFQNFLNSLDFPIQIFVQSKRLDIRPYLKMLKEREKAQLIDAMKIQVHEYIEFITRFTEQTNIMSKSFFIVVPYQMSVPIAGGKGGMGMFGKKKETTTQKQDESKLFEEARVQLEQRVSIVEQGLARCDIRTTRLGSEEVTELFYKKFNPGELDAAIQDT